jgi:hypothetical protein
MARLGTARACQPEKIIRRLKSALIGVGTWALGMAGSHENYSAKAQAARPNVVA